MGEVVEITMLGTGGGMPMPDRHLASAIINYMGKKILIDCGEGTQVSMKKVGTGFKNIDIICITHAHGDHIIGLPGLLSTIGNSDRALPIKIIGPIGIKEVVKGLRVVCPYLPYEVEVIEMDDENNNIKIDDFNISVLEVDHSAPCIGYSFYFERLPKFDVDKAIKNNVPKDIWSRLQKGEEVNIEGKVFNKDMVLGESREGIKLSYVTDTRANDKIVDFVYGSDLLILEGTYGDDNDIEKAIKNKHMTFREGATIARKSKAEKLLLTHFSPAITDPKEYLNNAQEVFPKTQISEDHMKVIINYK